MILHSFAFLTNIGLPLEKELWDKGIYTWSKFDEYSANTSSSSWLYHWQKQRKSVADKINAKQIDLLLSSIPKKLHWRILPLIQDDLVYLDLEMNQKNGQNNIIMATCLFQDKVHTFTKDENFNEFKNFLSDKKFLVTFGGTKNDLPLLNDAFEDLYFDLHIDLKSLTKSIGLQGGLKAIENSIGIKRKYCPHLSGSDIPLLWDQYTSKKDNKILNNIKHYNAEDVLHLPQILNHCWYKKVPVALHDYENCQLNARYTENPYQWSD